MTDLSNGEKENVAAHTVSTALTKNVGVSVTDVATDRQGDDKDERKRAYGFYYDFGKGLRLNYGYNKSLVGDVTGSWSRDADLRPNPRRPRTRTQMNKVGAGDIGGILVGGGVGYRPGVLRRTRTRRTPRRSRTSGSRPRSLSDSATCGIIKISFASRPRHGLQPVPKGKPERGPQRTAGQQAFSPSPTEVNSPIPIANPNATTDVDARSAIDRSVSLTTDPNPKAPLVVNGSIKVARPSGRRRLHEPEPYGVTARPICRASR